MTEEDLIMRKLKGLVECPFCMVWTEKRDGHCSLCDGERTVTREVNEAFYVAFGKVEDRDNQTLLERR